MLASTPLAAGSGMEKDRRQSRRSERPQREITVMPTLSSAGPSAAARAMRQRQSMEWVARAFGATCPSLIVAILPPNCADVPAALAALREPRGPAPDRAAIPPPQWFAPVPSPGVRDQAAAAAAGERAPVPIVVYDDGPGAGFRC
jgi:hypothetical protein